MQFPPDRLESDRFVLRPFAPSDADALHAAVARSRDHLAPFIWWGDRHATLDRTRQEIRVLTAKWMSDEDYVLGIFGTDGTLQGGTGFHPRKGALGEGTTEVGMWLDVRFAGAGLGTAVLRALHPWAFTAWWWERLEWRCDVHNHASAAVARKAGFVHEGTLRQHRVDHEGTRRDTMIFAALRADVLDPAAAQAASA